MDHNSPQKVVTRFAPSPTGFLHIGGVRTALFAYFFAHQHGGEFILRIEDTDKNREVAGSIKHIQDSLRWLGLEWHYGPDKPGPFGSCLQSDRLDIYKQYAMKLVEKGLAYPDPYTDEEVAAFRTEAEAEKRPFLFKRHRPATSDTWDGTKPLRFKSPDVDRVTWHDAVRGELSAGSEMVDDFILIKADGYPTYNFAHIVDDHEMQVTHVMRGEEFIASTPKFITLYEALEIPQPVLATLPPIMGPDGKKKLSKRDGAKDLLDFEKDGYLPETMCNFLALIGWNPGGEQEIFTMAELTAAFSLEKVQRSGGAFNEDKLRWMNKEHLQTKDDAFKVQYFSDALGTAVTTEPQYDPIRVAKLAPVAFERIHTKVEISEAYAAGEYAWAFATPQYETALLKWKNDTDVAAGLPRLEHVAELLSAADFSTTETIKAAVWPYAEEVGRGEVLWPLRAALSGQERSPDPFTLAFILGPAETLVRIEAACDKIRG